MRKLLVIFLFSAGLTRAQDLPPELQRQAEWQAEEGREEAPEEWLEDLRPFLRHPLDLNTATSADLQAFPFLSSVQIEQLLRYRQLIGPLVQVYEMQAVPGWEPATIRKLLPYVRVGDPRALAEQLADRLEGMHHLALLFAAGSEAPDPKHLGSPWALQLRYRFQYKNLVSAGLTADKDAGEQFFRGAQKAGFDQYSAHVYLKNLGPFEAIALGDFRLRLGQGLVHWDGNSLGPGLNPVMSERFSAPVTPYRSASVAGFQRGLGLTVRRGAWRFSPFFSQRRLDGNRREDGSISSLLFTGYRRTAAELADRSALRLRTAGFRLERAWRALRLGANGIHYQLSRELLPAAEPYNRFAFRGRSLALASFDGSGTWRNLHVFGEGATNGRHTAFLAGLLVALHARADLSFVYRRFAPGYATLFAQSFARYGEPQNETGFYLGLNLRPAPPWELVLAADVYRSPFLRYRLPAPTAGASYWAQLMYRRNKRFSAYARLRLADRPTPVAATALLKVDASKLLSARLQVDQLLDAGADLSARLEWNHYTATGQPSVHGFLFYLDHSRRLGRLRLTLRWQWVDTDSYENRFYAYEPSLPMSFALPAAGGRQTRLYVLIRYPLLKRLRLELRWVQAWARELASLEQPAGGGRSVQDWGAYLSWQF